jgi:restriction system protein
MGSINFSGAEMFGSLSDAVGSKSGLALNRRHIVDFLEADGRFSDIVDAGDEDWVRVHSSVYEEMAEVLLFKVGRLERLNNLNPLASLLQKYGRTPKVVEKATDIAKLFMEFFEGLDLSKTQPGTGVDPTPFLIEALNRHGRKGFAMANDFLAAYNTQLLLKSIHFPEVYTISHVIELDELFASEGLGEKAGSYLDQRYIDFLHRNFDRIDDMNWRKFEGLTADFFSRHGFEVELGEGRNDDGVDVRVWPSGEDPSKPPAIIVQCKRQRASIEKVIVKSLFADVLHNDAKSGLVVTTSRLSPGADAVCKARRYPVEVADRATVRRWVEEMRKPGMGMAE